MFSSQTLSNFPKQAVSHIPCTCTDSHEGLPSRDRWVLNVHDKEQQGAFYPVLRILSHSLK